MKLIYTTQYGVKGSNRRNPILAEFREHMSGIIGAQYRLGGEASWWLWLMDSDPYLQNSNYWGSTFLRDHASLRHVIHARRVLELIEAVFGPETEKVREELAPLQPTQVSGSPKEPKPKPRKDRK